MHHSSLFRRDNKASRFDIFLAVPHRAGKLGLWSELWRAIYASRQQAASRAVLPYLIALDDEDLVRLGHSRSEIRDLRARAGKDE